MFFSIKLSSLEDSTAVFILSVCAAHRVQRYLAWSRNCVHPHLLHPQVWDLRLGWAQ